MSEDRRAAVLELLERIQQFNGSGLDSEKIATAILDTEPETALFLTSLLLDIIVENVIYRQVR